MAVIAIIIRLNLGSLVIFRQERPGLNGKPFTIYKFQIMSNSRNAKGNLLSDVQLITSLGRLLRKTNLVYTWIWIRNQRKAY